MLLVSLLLTALIATMGLGFVTSRQLRYAGTVRAVNWGQAKALAQAGMEDARVKIERDLDFPPQRSEDQSKFSYRETLTDSTGVNLGSYVVTIDLAHAGPPYHVLRVRSRGLVGPNPALPTGTCTIYAEYDVRPVDPVTPNPRDSNQYRVINWVEDTP